MTAQLVSIVMPVYNAGTYLVQSIKSVLNQTYGNWELLIVDDCSTDNSADIIKSFVSQDGRIHYFKTSSPSGSPTAPRNIGIEKSSGRFIAFLDSDDIWLPKKLEEQLPLFENSDTAIVYSNYEKMSEEGIRNKRFVVAPMCTDYKNLLCGNVIGCLTAVYDVEKIGKLYFKPIKHEDYVLWLAILKKGFKGRNTGTVNALYRVRKNSVSSNKWKVLSWQWNIYVQVEKVGYLKAIYYFINYALKAYKKKRI